MKGSGISKDYTQKTLPLLLIGLMETKMHGFRFWVFEQILFLAFAICPMPEKRIILEAYADGLERASRALEEWR